ncbi:MAG: peptidase [Nioella sp.]|nr:peptidase [Nioella sp.]
MCTICTAFRPFDPECSYEAFGPQTVPFSNPTFANIAEIVSSPASTGTSNVMSVGDTFSGALQALGDDDWVAIPLSAGQSYEIDLSGTGGAGELNDPYLRLYNASGMQIASNDDGGGGLDSRLTFTPATSGTYYISARAWNDSGTGSYQVAVTAAATPGTAPVGTMDDLADYLTDGNWNDNGGTRHAFDTSTSNVITVNITGLTGDGQRLARWAMEAWESVADINFAEITGSARITFDDNQPGAYASYSAIGGVTQSAFVNVSTNWLTNYGTQIDDYAFSTYVHELGHALGLGHQGDYNGAATYGVDETFANDSYQASVMSYFSQTENSFINASYGQPITAMIADIIAIQELYGAPGAGSRTAGDTVYGVGQTVGGYLGILFDAALGNHDPNNYYGDENVVLTLYDQGGTDTVDLSTDTADQRVDLSGGGIWNVLGLIGNIVVADGTVIENYTAGSGNDSVLGNAADNTLFGNDGNDTLLGGLGADRLVGGAGRDLASYAQAGGGVLADLQFAFANTGEATGDTYSGIEDITGSDQADDLRGDARDNVVSGGGGDDFLYGRDGDDTLLGGAGNDILIGGNGADLLNGGAGQNRISYWTSNVDLLADLQFTFVNTGVAAGDSYIGIQDIQGSAGNDEIRGNNYDNNIWGNAGQDVLYGRDGDDRLFGHFGNDTLLGNFGADLLNGGDGIDRASYWTATSGVTADLMAPWANTGEARGDTYVQIEELQGSSQNDILRGDNADNGIWGAAGDDQIVGRGGNDYLEGHLGRDTLEGGAGNDTLMGGAHADTFVFAQGRDVILDFQNDADQIDLSRALWGGQALTAQQVVIDFATVIGANTVLDFGGGNTLTINNLGNPGLLVDDIIFS